MTAQLWYCFLHAWQFLDMVSHPVSLLPKLLACKATSPIKFAPPPPAPHLSHCEPGALACHTIFPLDRCHSHVAITLGTENGRRHVAGAVGFRDTALQQPCIPSDGHVLDMARHWCLQDCC